MEKKKTIEFNFIIFMALLLALLVIVFVVARKTGNKNIIYENNNVQEENADKKEKEEGSQETKLYANNLVIIDEGKLTSNWQIVEKSYGSILFYIQGPKEENDDGTFNEIKINIYMQKSEMTNEELKSQMLNNSIYSKIQYDKIQEINSLQWMEFSAENKGVKAKILTLMKDGYMYAAEIVGEETKYDEYYNEAMKVVMTIQIAKNISLKDASDVIYKFDNISNIKEGGTLYLLTSLNLPKEMEQNEENTNLPEEYKEYKWTGIKYSVFENEMKKYMTTDVLKTKFSEFIEFKDSLFVKETSGNQIEYMIEEIKPIKVKGYETTFEVTKTRMDTYEKILERITLKLENEKVIVSAFGDTL